MPEPIAPALERILSRPESGPRSIVDLALKRDPARPDAVSASQPPSYKARLNRRVYSLPIPAPRTDWAKLVTGTKRMYRTYSGSWHDRQLRLIPEGVELPRPGLIYARDHKDGRGNWDAALMVILGYRQERLGEMTPADMRIEGFQMMGQFRRYWKRRYDKLGWRPNDLVSVVQLRPWQEGDDEEQGAWLLRQLYGEFL